MHSDGNALIESQLLPQLGVRSQEVAGFVASIYTRLNSTAAGGVNGIAVALSPPALEFLRSSVFAGVIAAIEPDVIMRGMQQTQPDAPWQLDRVDQRSPQLNRQYQFTNTGEGVDIYVLDSGINAAHEDFAGRIEGGVNFDPDQQATDFNDCNGHGTHVSGAALMLLLMLRVDSGCMLRIHQCHCFVPTRAGLAAGTTYGVAKGATIIPVRIYGCDNAGPVSQALAGINYVLASSECSTVGARCRRCTTSLHCQHAARHSLPSRVAPHLQSNAATGGRSSTCRLVATACRRWMTQWAR